MSAFPRIISYPQSSFLNFVRFTSKGQKSGLPLKVLKQDFTSNAVNSNNNNCLFLSHQNTDINLRKESDKESDEKTKQKAFTFVNGLQTKYNSQELNKATKSQLQQNNLDNTTEEKLITLEYKENNPKESMHG